MSDWDYIGQGGFADLRRHVFKRSGTVTLDAQGAASITFDPPLLLDREPHMQLQPWVEPGGNPVFTNVVTGSLTQTGGRYTGVSISGARAQDLPGGLTAVNVAVSLNNRKVTEAGTLEGVRVDWIVF